MAVGKVTGKGKKCVLRLALRRSKEKCSRNRRLACPLEEKLPSSRGKRRGKTSPPEERVHLKERHIIYGKSREPIPLKNGIAKI